MDLTLAWVKGIHISALVIWCAGLFYLPGLFASHCRKHEPQPFYRLRAITRVSYLGVTSPAAIIAVISGSALVWLADISGGWLPVKLTLVGMMAAYHALCGHVLFQLREEQGYRPLTLLSLMLVPAALIPPVLWLVLAKPL
ncbi:MAG: CopD family protein [Pseudomonadales bacterium]